MSILPPMFPRTHVEQAFKGELRALLDKYNATLTAQNYWTGFAECGEDIRMEVDIPALYDDDGNCVREFTTVNLGTYF